MVFSQGIEPVVHGLPLRLGVFQGIHRLPQGIASGQARPLPPDAAVIELEIVEDERR